MLTGVGGVGVGGGGGQSPWKTFVLQFITWSTKSLEPSTFFTELGPKVNNDVETTLLTNDTTLLL